MQRAAKSATSQLKTKCPFFMVPSAGKLDAATIQEMAKMCPQ